MRSKYIIPSRNYFDLPDLEVNYNFIIDEHRDMAAIDFWNTRHDDEGKLIPLPRLSGPAIYNALLKDHFLDEATTKVNSKIGKFLTNHSPSPPTDASNAISSNLSSLHPSPSCLLHHFRLIMNALPTTRRRRHSTNTSLAQVPPCFFCGNNIDSIDHFYTSNCPITSSAHNLFFASIHTTPPPFDLLHSFLCAPVEKTKVIPTLAFNLALWKFRTSSPATPTMLRTTWLPNKIKDLALSLHQACISQANRANPRSQLNLESTTKRYLSLVNGLPPKDRKSVV